MSTKEDTKTWHPWEIIQIANLVIPLISVQLFQE
jgi:hypothetical protein